MASLLTPEQADLYLSAGHTVDVYESRSLAGSTSGGSTDPGWVTTPTAIGVPCYRETKPNFDSPYILGRTDADNIMTQDKFHLPVMWDSGQPALEVGGEYLLHFHCAGHLEDGMCFVTQGQTTIKNLMANKQMILAKPTIKPKFLLS